VTSTKPLLQFDLHFSYAQFSIFDKSLDAPFLEWSERHSAQGFVRGSGIIAAGTILSHGVAHAAVYMEPVPPRGLETYDRVIAIPLDANTGHLAISNPDALPEEAVALEVPSGHYRVFVAQKLDEERKHENIDVILVKCSSSESRSEILVADASLTPAYPLLEDPPAEV
jgi:hypothetical protein